MLNDDESKEFEKKDYFKKTIMLRKFDEAAKKTDVKIKSIYEYRILLNLKLI